MVQDPQIPAHNLILKKRVSRYIDSLPVICNNDNSASEGDVSPEVDVTGYSEVVQF